MCSCYLKDKYSSQPTVSAMRREEMRKNEGREVKKSQERNGDDFFSAGAQSERQSRIY